MTNPPPPTFALTFGMYKLMNIHMHEGVVTAAAASAAASASPAGHQTDGRTDEQAASGVECGINFKVF